jgi:hypothetical protein
VTFVTSRGRRVAAVVSVAAAEQAAAVDGQPSDDAITATSYAVKRQMLQDRGGAPGLTPAECFENYADALLREFGSSADRAPASARAVTANSAGETGYPMLWRHVALAANLHRLPEPIIGELLKASSDPRPQLTLLVGRQGPQTQ